MSSRLRFLQETDEREFVEADDSDISDFEVNKTSGVSCLEVSSTSLVSLVMDQSSWKWV